MSKRSSEKLGKIPPRAAFLEEKPSFHRGRGGSSKSRVCFYENSSPIRATIFPLTKQDTESLSRYGCFAYRSSQLFLFSQCNEFRFNALSLLPPSPIDSRVRPDGILRNEWARRRHERRRVIEPLKLSFADPNFVAVGINADTIDDVPGNFSSLSLPSFYRGEEEIRLGPEVGEDRWMHEVEDV